MALEDAALLTQAQLDTLKFIDCESEHGYLYACVQGQRRLVLKNLERRGFIRLREEDNLLWAMPSADGLEALDWHVLSHSAEAFLMRGYYEKRAAKRRAERQQLIEERMK